MAISKGLLLYALVANCFAGLPSVAASVPLSPTVDSGHESSTLLTRISYSDLFDLFGGTNLAQTESADDAQEDRESTEKLVGILKHNHRKITPLLNKIEEAFGSIGSDRLPALGFLEVTGLPPEMVDLRQRLLPRASELANLPSEELAELEKPETGYSIGWSHGRESFRVFDDNGNESSSNETEKGIPKRRYDTAKGSFYMNPYADVNVYPPSLQPFLEDYLLEMTRFMSEVGLWIAVLCDLYLVASAYADCSREQECSSRHEADNENPDFASSILSNEFMVYKSLKYGKPAAKARLLYYFPQGQHEPRDQEISTPTDSDNVFDDWCGWHTDHGTLTALLPGMLTETQKQKDPPEALRPSSSGPKPGLYIKTKIPVTADHSTDESKEDTKAFRERLVHASLAPDSLGFQLGETLEILSGGKFVATPHAVKAPSSGALSVGRASLAVFLQPQGSQVLPPLVSRAGNDEEDDSLSLRNRWRTTFGEFQRVTIESFS